MKKDAFYLEACDDAKEMAHHGIHWTDEVVEDRATKLRSMAGQEDGEHGITMV